MPILLLAVFALIGWVFVPIALQSKFTIEVALLLLVVTFLGMAAIHRIYHASILTFGHVEIVVVQDQLLVTLRAGPLRMREMRTLSTLTDLVITRWTRNALNAIRPIACSDMPEPASLVADGLHAKPIVLANGYPAAWLIPLAHVLQKLKPDLSLKYDYLNEDNVILAEDAGPVEPEELPSLPKMPESTEIEYSENEDEVCIEVPKPRISFTDLIMMGFGLFIATACGYLIYQRPGMNFQYIEGYILLFVAGVMLITGPCLFVALPAQRLATETRFVIRSGPVEPLLIITRHGLLGTSTDTLPATTIRAITVENAEMNGGDREKQMLVIRRRDDKQLRLLRNRQALDLKWVAAVLNRKLLHEALDVPAN